MSWLDMQRMMLEEHLILLKQYDVLESKKLTMESIILYDPLTPMTIEQIVMILEDSLEGQELVEMLEYLAKLIQERSDNERSRWDVLRLGAKLVQDRLSAS